MVAPSSGNSDVYLFLRQLLSTSLAAGSGGDSTNLQATLGCVAVFKSLPVDALCFPKDPSSINETLLELKLLARCLLLDTDGVYRDYNFHGVNAPWAICDIIQLSGKLLSSSLTVTTATATTVGIQAVLDLCKLVIDSVADGVDSAYFVLLCAVNLLTTEAWKAVGECTAVDSHQVAAIQKEIKRLLYPLPASFMRSSNNNLRYIGLSLLHCIAPVDLSIVTEYQLEVVDCLEQQIDGTLTEKSLQLLFIATHTGNYQLVFDKSLEYLNRLDESCTSLIVKQLILAVERYASDSSTQQQTEMLLRLLDKLLTKTDNNKLILVDNDIIHDLIDSLDSLLISCQPADEQLMAAKALSKRLMKNIELTVGCRRLFDFVLDYSLREQLEPGFFKSMCENAAKISDEQLFLVYMESLLTAGTRDGLIETQNILECFSKALADRSVIFFESRRVRLCFTK